MRHIVLAVSAIVVLAAAYAAAALPMTSCCACLPLNATVRSASFCAQAPPADPGDLSEQCTLGSNQTSSLTCIPGIPGLPCVKELADAGITCPSAGVPAATDATALALAVTLAAGGTLLLRRRRRGDA